MKSSPLLRSSTISILVAWPIGWDMVCLLWIFGREKINCITLSALYIYCPSFNCTRPWLLSESNRGCHLQTLPHVKHNLLLLRQQETISAMVRKLINSVENGCMYALLETEMNYDRFCFLWKKKQFCFYWIQYYSCYFFLYLSIVMCIFHIFLQVNNHGRGLTGWERNWYIDPRTISIIFCRWHFKLHIPRWKLLCFY